MKFGVCGDPAQAVKAKQAGYDYFEWSVGGLLQPRESEASFLKALDLVRNTGLPCPVLNVFIPSDLKITGPDAGSPELETYVRTALRRAQIAGVDTIVFGSGGARQVPDGFDRQTAWSQLVSFGRLISSIAAENRVTIVIEPLNRAECNILNTVAESASLVEEINHLNLRLLVDGYHWAKDHDSPASIINNSKLLRHAHIATVEGRKPPHPGDPCADFLTILRQAGYSGRLSIEGNIADLDLELPRALEIMRAASLNSP